MITQLNCSRPRCNILCHFPPIIIVRRRPRHARSRAFTPACILFAKVEFTVQHSKVIGRPELSPDHREELRQYHELRAKLEASDALRLQQAARLGRSRFYTYEANMRELFSLVCSHSRLQREDRLGDFLNRKPLHNFLYECTRRLQNFVTSAVVLINYSKKVVENDHRKNPQVMTSFRKGIAAHLDC